MRIEQLINNCSLKFFIEREKINRYVGFTTTELILGANLFINRDIQKYISQERDDF